MVLHADRRPKQNHNDENLPALPKEPYLLGKELGQMLNQENIHSPIMRCRRNHFMFFVMETYLEKMMEQLNSGEPEMIFGRYFPHCRHWSDEKWKSTMAKGGGNKKRFQYCSDSSEAIL